MPTVLAVLWRPPARPLSADMIALSFLPALEEEALRTANPNVIGAREILDQVRDRAVQIYTQMCVGLGIVTDRSGKTFRAAMQRAGECSDWWFHPVSSKDYEAPGLPPTLEWITALLAVESCMDANRLSSLHTVGAPAPLVRVLRTKYVVEATQSTRGVAPGVRLHALLSRVLLASSMIRLIRLLPRRVDASPDQSRPLVALTGVWPGTLMWDAKRRTIVDRFHKGLADALSRRDMRTVRYVWCFGPPSGADGDRSWREPFATGEAVALQTALGWRDVVRVLASFRAYRVYVRWSWRRAFREAFRWNGFDTRALFRIPLLYHFLGPIVPLCRLTAIATARTCQAQQPAATVSHLEHFSLGRAHFEGVAAARTATLATTVQHSSVSRRTSYYHLDSRIEFEGVPDGAAVPRPGHVFAMGAAGAALFEEWGYASRQVSMTGSPRFDHLRTLRQEVRQRRLSRAQNDARSLRVLITSGVDARMEAELVEAVCAAARNLRGIQVWLRPHPAAADRWRGRDQRFAPELRVTEGTLADDLVMADLVICCYSTLGAEAFSCGAPVWQWLSTGHDAAALADAVAVPRFHAIPALRRGLEAFQMDPQAFAPSPADVAAATSRIFGPVDGRETERIADTLAALLDARDQSHAAHDPPRVAAR